MKFLGKIRAQSLTAPDCSALRLNLITADQAVVYADVRTAAFIVEDNLVRRDLVDDELSVKRRRVHVPSLPITSQPLLIGRRFEGPSAILSRFEFEFIGKQCVLTFPTNSQVTCRVVLKPGICVKIHEGEILGAEGSSEAAATLSSISRQNSSIKDRRNFCDEDLIHRVVKAAPHRCSRELGLFTYRFAM